MQSDDMHRVFAPGNRDFHAIDKLDAAGSGGLCGFFQPRHVIVVSQGQYLHLALGSTRHQLGGREGSIGIAGMAMQVVIEHQRSPPPFFMTFPSSARLRRTSLGSAISGR